mgnify:CR=1 FL=1
MTFSELSTLIVTIDKLLEDNPSNSSLPSTWRRWIVQSTPVLTKIRHELLALLQIEATAAGHGE